MFSPLVPFSRHGRRAASRFIVLRLDRPSSLPEPTDGHLFSYILQIGPRAPSPGRPPPRGEVRSILFPSRSRFSPQKATFGDAPTFTSKTRRTPPPSFDRSLHQVPGSFFFPRRVVIFYARPTRDIDRSLSFSQVIRFSCPDHLLTLVWSVCFKSLFLPSIRDIYDFPPPF